ncbi:hypothetical protein Tco_0500741, partial [Tanacetum coccineum]
CESGTITPRLRYQEPPYALPETLLAPVTHNDPRDPYVAARDAATTPTYRCEPKRQLSDASNERVNAAVRGRYGERQTNARRQGKTMKLGANGDGAQDAREWRGLDVVELQGCDDADLEAHNRIGWTEMRRKMVPSERKKIEAYIRGLTDNIKGTVIGSKPISLNEAVRMAHALMEQKAQARIERITEGNKRKWESSQGGNN